jgi:hypothetical protein
MTSRDQCWLEKQAAVLEMMRPEITMDTYYYFLVATCSSARNERIIAEKKLFDIWDKL